MRHRRKQPRQRANADGAEHRGMIPALLTKERLNMPRDGTMEQERTAARRPIPGFPGYEVDSLGNIYSVGSNWRGYGCRRMAAFPNKDGYLRARLTVRGSRRKLAVHHAVALAFIGPRPAPHYEVRHLNGARRDNRAVNICWGTRADNAADRERHGRTSKGPRHAKAIRTGRARAALEKAEGRSA